MRADAVSLASIDSISVRIKGLGSLGPDLGIVTSVYATANTITSVIVAIFVAELVVSMMFSVVVSNCNYFVINNFNKTLLILISYYLSNSSW